MKIIKLVIAAAALMAVMGSCKSKTCPGYGEAQQETQQMEVNA